jgi:hypothetical protein
MIRLKRTGYADADDVLIPNWKHIVWVARTEGKDVTNVGFVTGTVFAVLNSPEEIEVMIEKERENT